MRYFLLGKSGLRVSEISLGTMTFGEEWGWGASKEESRKQFDLYVERGGNFIDTANRYTEGTSERFVGEFVGSRRAEFVIATKYTLFQRKGDPNSSGNQRKNLVQSLESSLQRLKTDYIDLYIVHAWDYLTPVEEVMRALDDQVRAGKVLYVGISDTPAWIVSQANTLASFRGWSPFVSLQIEYSLIERTVERELLPMAQALDLTITPWAPIGGGLLSGKYNRKNLDPTAPKRISEGGRRLTERNLSIAEEVGKIADELGKKPSQVALNWVRQRSQQMIPIVGARTVAQLAENLDCIDFDIPAEQIEKLNKVSAIELGFPHDFLLQPPIQDLVYAGTQGKITRH